MTTAFVRATDPALVARLKRADGHLRAVIGMIAAARSRPEAGQQMQAVEMAVANAKRGLIHDHMDHSIDATHSPADRCELKAISRYL